MNTLLEDLKAQREGLLSPGFWALIVYRFGHSGFMAGDKIVRAPWTIVCLILSKLAQIVCGITRDVPDNTAVGGVRARPLKVAQ